MSILSCAFGSPAVCLPSYNAVRSTQVSFLLAWRVFFCAVESDLEFVSSVWLGLGSQREVFASDGLVDGGQQGLPLCSSRFVDLGQQDCFLSSPCLSAWRKPRFG